MLNCIRTDTLRVLKKKNFIIATLVFYLIIIIGAVSNRYLGDFQEELITMGFDMGDLVFSTIIGAILSFFVIVPGIVIYQSVFADDLRSRSTQAVLGGGLTRNQLIVARFLETMLLAGLVILFAFILIAGLGVFFNAGPSTIWNLLKDFGIYTFLPYGCFISISMIFVYPFQSSTFGMVVYLLLESDMGTTLASAISMLPFLSKRGIDLSHYTVNGLLRSYGSAPDRQPWILLIVLGAYLILPILLTQVLFRNRELEF